MDGGACSDTSCLSSFMQSEEELGWPSSTFNETLGGAVCYSRSTRSLVILKSLKQLDCRSRGTSRKLLLFVSACNDPQLLCLEKDDTENQTTEVIKKINRIE
ncbi:hypothetical protein ILYODFUR_005606 [Ilyodon furcidens]|uniref:Uncharacterized protein n=1 Tax=Ilyodon furcidens TaxID=33524 RepID=A0ABV0VDS1_9TELE